MSSTYINNIQENEIDKILQDGIDKSLKYIQSLNNTNSNKTYSGEINTSSNLIQKYATAPINQTKIKRRTAKNSNRSKSKGKNKNIFNKKRSLSKNNIKKNNYNYNYSFPLSHIEPNDNNKTNNNPKLIKRAKSINKIKGKKKLNNILDYQLEYNRKRDELEKYKKLLIQERIKQNKLQKEMNSKSKKEEEFRKLEENSLNIKNNSDELILKIQRSEKLREEQAKIIDGLLKEYNSMIKALRNNPDVEIVNKYGELESEAEKLKKEGNMSIKADKARKKSHLKKYN
jgi:hypothetical protein